jgi:hypothetical protein
MEKKFKMVLAVGAGLVVLVVMHVLLRTLFPVEGIALAFLGGLFGGGDKTTTTTLDPETQQYVDWSRGVTQRGVDTIGGMGPMFAGPDWQSRMGARQVAGLGGFANDPRFQQYMQGMQGMAGMAGRAQEQWGPEAMQRLMDPYNQQVISGLNAQWDRSGRQAQIGVGQNAALQGAFGGSRHGVAEGVAANLNEQGRNQQIGEALSQGYYGAQNQFNQDRMLAQQQAMGGLGGIFQGGQYGNAWDLQRGQANMQSGEYMRALQERMMQEPMFRAQMQAQMANAGVGPYGTTSTEHTSGNFLGGLLGAGMLGAQLIPGIGTGISQLGSALGLGGNIMGGTL